MNPLASLRCCDARLAAFRFVRLLIATTAGIFLVVDVNASAQEVQLVGRLQLNGTMLDLSGLEGSFADGTPVAQLGGFSAIEYDSLRQRYVLLPDRGPEDGAHSWLCRYHELEVSVPIRDRRAPSARLLATHLLKNETGESLVGLAQAINQQHPELSLRFDPEGVRVGRDGAFYISDEYGPHLFAFDRTGKLRRRFELPAGFTIDRPAVSEELEHAHNQHGRQTNRGLEGLAISPDGNKLYAMMQGPLHQDHALDADGERLGLHTRLIEFDLRSGATRQFVYVLDRPKYGISEILAFSDNQILVLERDSKPSSESKAKRIYLADLTAATDVSGVESLPASTLPATIRPMQKSMFLDLLDPRFGLVQDLPAKIEGLAFGPDLPDGRRLLAVCSDNDFRSDEASQLYFFAVSQNSEQPPSQHGYQLPAGLHHTLETRYATGPLPLAEGLRYESFTEIQGPTDLHHGIAARHESGLLNAVIEIPSGTNAKWEVKDDGQMHWEVRDGQPRIVNFLPYPGNYGFIPQTLLRKDEGGDGDPLDVLVLGPAVPRGSVLPVRVIGVMKFLDRGEQDDKLLAVVANTPLGAVRSIQELNESFPGASQIVMNWFQFYKGPGKMEFQGWGEVDVTQQLVEKAIHSAQSVQKHP